MNANGRRRKVRVVMTPVSPVDGTRRDGPILILTYPKHRFLVRYRRWCRANWDNPFFMTPDRYHRYEMTATDENLKADIAGQFVIHLGDSTERIDEGAGELIDLVMTVARMFGSISRSLKASAAPGPPVSDWCRPDRHAKADLICLDDAESDGAGDDEICDECDGERTIDVPDYWSDDGLRTVPCPSCRPDGGFYDP